MIDIILQTWEQNISRKKQNVQQSMLLGANQEIGLVFARRHFAGHTGKSELWRHGLVACTLDACTLGLWTLRLWIYGCLDSGHLDSGRLHVLALGDWTLDAWMLGLWIRGPRKFYSFLVTLFLLLFRHIIQVEC